MDQEEIRNVNKLIREGEHELVAKKYEQALDYFGKAFDIDSKNLVAIVNMGFCYAKLGKLQQAQTCFATALDLNPHNIVARRNLERILRPQGIPYPDPFKKSMPDKETIFLRYIELAQKGIKNKNLFSAIQYFEAASSIHPHLIDPYLRIASCYEELGETEQACRAFKQALSIYSGDETAQEGIKRCCAGISTEVPKVAQTIGSQDMVQDLFEQYSDDEPATEVVETSANDDDDVEEEAFEIIEEGREKPSASPPSQDDDPISLILDQFKDEGETEKKKKPVPQPASIPVEDDPISLILDQFRDDAAPENQSASEEGQIASATQADTPAPAPPVGTKMSEKNAILDILDQYKDDIADDANATAESAQAPKVVQTIGSQDMVQDLLARYSDEISADEPIADKTPVASEKPIANKTPVASEKPIADTDQDVPHTGSAPEIGKQKTKQDVQESDKAVPQPVILTEEQRDAFQELGNIGASHAATTLSTMLQTTILMNVPEIRIISVDEISGYIGDGNSAFAIFTMEGEIHQAGYVILQVMKESVIQISAIMLGMPSEEREMNEMDESAITEIGNIMVSAFLDGTAELLGIIMLPSPPRTIMGKSSTVIADVVESGDINCDNIVFFKTEMICNDYALQCNILMMPSQSILYDILEMLENLITE